MRGSDRRSGELFSYVDVEMRVRTDHPLRTIRSVAPSYVSRVLRLTLLAPEIIEAILDGRQPAELQLEKGVRLE